MITNYVCCCDCEYAEICLSQDAYGGCKNGKMKENMFSVSLTKHSEDNAKLDDN